MQTDPLPESPREPERQPAPPDTSEPPVHPEPNALPERRFGSPNVHRRQFIAFSFFLLVAGFFATTFRLAVVHGQSMLPTYHDGQVVLVNKLKSIGGPLRRGDVVLVEKRPDVLIKRIAYLPGDIIGPKESFRYRRAWEYFDVIRLPTPPGMFPIRELKVPPGYYVVLGDNRAVSDDSRSFGPVPASDILGRVVNAPSAGP